MVQEIVGGFYACQWRKFKSGQSTQIDDLLVSIQRLPEYYAKCHCKDLYLFGYHIVVNDLLVGTPYGMLDWWNWKRTDGKLFTVSKSLGKEYLKIFSH